MRFLHFVGSAALIGLLSSPVHAATVTYVESTDGMISTDNLNPTDMGTFGIGISSISGSVSNALSAARTSDNFTFQLDPGTQLESIIIRDAVVPSNIAFVGMAEGPTFPYLSIGFGTINNDYLGIGALTFDDGDTVLFDSNTGENDFGALAAAQGGMGVIAPVLGPGEYTMFVQEFSAAPHTYTMEFSVTAIPEPSSFGVLALAGSVIAMRRRRTV